MNRGKKIQYDQLNINRIALVFKNKKLEKDYRNEYFKKSIVGFRLAFLVVIILYAIFGFLDKYLAARFVSEFFTIRYIIVVPLLLTVLGLSFFSFFIKMWQLLISLCYVVAGSGIAFMLLKDPENIYYYGGLFLIFIAGYFFIKLHFLWAVFPGILTLLFFNIAPFLSNSLNIPPFEFLVSNNAFYVAANIIAAIALYNNELIERREFVQRVILKEQQIEIRKINESLEEKIKERTQLLQQRNKSLKEEIENRKQIEEVLIEAKHKAEESDRLKSAFLANMSHEIRTPMNGIMGFLQLLTETEVNKDTQDKFLNIIKQSGDRLLQTINDIVEISKIEAGEQSLHQTTVNLGESFKYYTDFFAPEAKQKGIQLIFPNDAEFLTIKADSNKLDSVFTNLLRNAFKFTKSGQIEVSWGIEENYIKFAVRDTGTGIPKVRQEAIFDRFVQADLSISRGYEGVGLGLSICKAYIELMGGKIWLNSTEGEGSTFFFTVPLKHTEKTSNVTDVIVEKQKNTGTTKNNPLTVLVAEDDGVSYNLLDVILNNQKMNVLRAVNGREAIDMYKKHKDEVSIILMDIKMPVMNGLDATREIRKIDKTIPIIAQTAYAFASDKEDAFKSGCTGYLAKPVKQKDLLKVINDNIS